MMQSHHRRRGRGNLAAANGLTCLEAVGWRAVEVELLCSGVGGAAHRFDRLPRWMRFLAWLPQPVRAIRATRSTAGLSALRLESDYFGAVSSSAMLSGSRNSRM